MKKCTCLYKAGCGRTLGVLPLWVAPGEGAGVSRIVSLSPPTTLPTPSPKNQQRPAPKWVHSHPYSLGKQLADLCHVPHTPGGGSQDQPGSLPCNCSPLWARPKGRCSVQVESKEVSAHHIIAIHAVSGVLHRVVDFSTECWQVLSEPVSVFR